MSRISKKLETYSRVGAGRDGSKGGEHCPIFFDESRVEVIESETRWFGSTPDVPSKLEGSKMNRIYTHARLEIQSGETISVFNSHFDEKSNERRQKSMDQLLGQIDSSVPTIILGDFNAQRSNEVFEKIEKHGLRFAHDENCGGTTHGFSRKTRQHAIDHILVSNHFEVKSSEVVRRRVFGMLPSDHWPVVAELKLNKSI